MSALKELFGKSVQTPLGLADVRLEAVENAEDEPRDSHGRWTAGQDIPTALRPKLKSGLYPKSTELHEAAADPAKLEALFKAVAPKDRGKLTRLMEELRTPVKTPEKDMVGAATGPYLKEGQRPATDKELSVLRESVDQMPKELAQFIPKDKEVLLAVGDKGSRNEFHGKVISLAEDNFDDAAKFIRQHELAHALVNPAVMERNGGASAMLKQLRDAEVPLSVHSNRASEDHGKVDEMLATLSGDHVSGRSVEEQVEKLTTGGGRLDVEPHSGHGSTKYSQSRAWTKEEATKAVNLWRQWHGISSSSQEVPSADLTAAHMLVKQAVGQANLAKLSTLRQKMEAAGFKSRQEQDAALLALLKTGKIGMSGPEGRHKISDEERAGWLKDGGQVYGHVYTRNANTHHDERGRFSSEDGTPPAKPTLKEFEEWQDKGWTWGEKGWEPPLESKREVSGEVPQSVHEAAKEQLSEEAKRLIASAHSWEESKPWNASKEDVKAGKVEGMAWGSYGGRGQEAAHYEDGKIVVSDKFFALGHEESRRHVLYHELGHQLADTMVGDGTSFQLHDAGVIPASHDLGSGTGGGHGDEEALADVYATIHTDPAWLEKHHPQLVKPVQDRARALGMPLP